MKNKYYAGIGSRETPPYILRTMRTIAASLEEMNYTLRSGGADGADYAFAKGCERKDIYIPWNNFNGISSDLVGASKEAFDIAREIHPAWDRCSPGAKKLHARNVHQILGSDINDETSYSEFVVCWTIDGKQLGGTATAIKLAESKGIPVFNLGKAGSLEELKKYISEKENK